MTQRDKLKALLREHGLPRSWVVRSLGVSPHTVAGWLLPDNSLGHRDISQEHLDTLLKLIEEE